MTTTTPAPSRATLASRLLDEVISPSAFTLHDSHVSQLAMIEEMARLLGDFADLSDQHREDLYRVGVRGVANAIAQSAKIAQILAEAINTEHRTATRADSILASEKEAKIARIFRDGSEPQGCAA